MNISRPAFVVALAATALGGYFLATQSQSRAQQGAAVKTSQSTHIAEAMYQPLRLPFGKGATLDELVAYLRKETHANVVLDLAALSRLKLTPAAKVRLDLDEIRLRTGLKLLLDQVGLTTKIIAEDNLLIITDRTEADDLLSRLAEEVKELHRDLHVVQDDVREVRSFVSAPVEEVIEPEAKMRNPTIIEEVPGGPKTDKGEHGDAETKSKKDKPTGKTRSGI